MICGCLIRGGRGGGSGGRKIISLWIPWEGMRSRGWREGEGGDGWGPDEDNGWMGRWRGEGAGSGMWS